MKIRYNVALLLSLGAAAAVVATAATALAQEGSSLRDPTRPPQWQGGLGGSGGAGEPGTGSALRLEAIKLGPEGQRLASISGQNLRLGEEIQGMRVVRIDAAAVLLQGPEGPEGRQELRLTPGVQAPQRPTPAAGGKQR